MAKCPLNKFKDCREQECKWYRTAFKFDDKGDSEPTSDCVINLMFNIVLDYLHGIRGRLVGVQQSTEQMRNIFFKALADVQQREVGEKKERDERLLEVK